MNKAEFLTIIFTVLGAVVTTLTSIEKGIIKKLQDKGATSSQTAVEVQKFKRSAGFRLNQLKKMGAIQETNAGKYYYDESVYKKFVRKRVVVVVAIIISIIVLVFTVYK